MSQDKMFEEYGPQKGLQEILEELSVYCMLAGVDNPQITVILPKRVQDAFNAEFMPKERIVSPLPSSNRSAVTELWCSGVVTIHNSDDYEVRKLSMWEKAKRKMRFVMYGKTFQS